MLDVAMAEYVVAVPFSGLYDRASWDDRMSGWEMSMNDQCVAGPARTARRGWHRPELVSTVRDYARFARMLADGGRFEGRQIVSQEHLRLMTSDQVPAHAKTPDSFFPGSWDGTGWGFGVGVHTEGGRAGRCLTSTERPGRRDNVA